MMYNGDYEIWMQLAHQLISSFLYDKTVLNLDMETGKSPVFRTIYD